MATKVLATGCFDALHPGHLELLHFAKGQGSILIVGLNCDASIRRLKGFGRPIYPEADRLFMVEAVRWVDSAFVFYEDNVASVIRSVRPHVWVRGADRALKDFNLEELNATKEVGCQVVTCPLKPSYSTTGLIKKLQA